MGKRRQRQLHLPCWPRVSNLHDFLFTSRGRGLLLGSVNEKLLITFFHSGLDQRKQTGGVIVALLKIRTKKKRALGIISVFFFFFPRAISLIMLPLCCLCVRPNVVKVLDGAVNMGTFFSSGLKPSFKKKKRRKDVYLKPVWCETGELVMKCNSSEWSTVRAALLALFSLRNTQTR